eukprot:PhF_6_TR7978/c0_g3_i6/m.12187
MSPHNTITTIPINISINKQYYPLFLLNVSLTHLMGTVRITSSGKTITTTTTTTNTHSNNMIGTYHLLSITTNHYTLQPPMTTTRVAFKQVYRSTPPQHHSFPEIVPPTAAFNVVSLWLSPITTGTPWTSGVLHF